MKTFSNRQIVVALLVSILVGGQLLAQGGPGGGPGQGQGQGQGQVCPHCQQGGPQGQGQGQGRGPAQMRGPGQGQFGPQGRGPQGPDPMHIGRVLRQLDLTEEQRDLARRRHSASTRRSKDNISWNRISNCHKRV